MFWKAENLIIPLFSFSGLFHVSIVDFQVDLCQKVGFACVIIESGGGLPDLGRFFFYHHFEDNCQARFLRYQTPESGTGNPSIGPQIDEVIAKNQILVPLAFVWVTIELFPDLA